jgi:hypothetical protein
MDDRRPEHVVAGHGPDAGRDRHAGRSVASMASVRTGLSASVAIAAVTLLSFRQPGSAAPGIDPSWHVGLHLAVAEPLAFGREFVLTYGPLGFLLQPHPFVGATSSIGVIYSALVYALIIALLVISARRVMPLWAAALVALVAARILMFVPPPEAQLAVVALLAVEVLGGGIRLAPRTIVVIAGIVAAVTLLGKLNVGIYVALAGAIVALAVTPARWRGLGLYAASSAAAAVVLWVVTGQALGDIPAFVATSLELVSGYSEAMGRDTAPALQWAYPAFALTAAALVWLGWMASTEWPRARRLALIGILAGLVFVLWKISFTRAYPMYAFAIPMAVAFPLVFRARSSARWRGWRVLVVPVFALFATASLATNSATPPALMNLRGSVSTAIVAASDLVVPGRADARVEAARSELRAALALPPAMVAAITDRTTHIDPWQTTVAFAYPEARWRPLPVFQTYMGYTTALDQLNADTLQGPLAPERILRERIEIRVGDRTTEQTVDGRSRWFEMPLSMLGMLCSYREVLANERWQVLARTEDRCGAPVMLSSETARTGTVVRVPTPRPGEFMTVRILGLNGGVMAKVRTALWRSEVWHIRQDLLPIRRLVPGTVDDGLLLAVPDKIEMHPDFAFGPPIGSIRVDSADPDATPTSLTYEFWSVPLAAP